MHKPRPAACPRRPRRGFLGLELVLTLPVVTLLLLSLFEFACLVGGYQAVAKASRDGVQLAAHSEVTAAEVAAAVKQSLSGALAEAAEVDCKPAPEAGETICSVRVPMDACAPNLLWPVGFDLQGKFIDCTVRTAIGPAAGAAQ